MKDKNFGKLGPATDPAFAEIDRMVAQADAEFKAVVKSVKPAYRERFLAIIERTDDYCLKHLEPLHRDYETLAHEMAAELCCKGSPVVEGKASPESWAAAIVATLGRINFLSDPSFPPVKTMDEVAAGFGVSSANLHAKSREIRELLDLMPSDPGWTLPSRLIDNPLVWMLETNTGMVIDIRALPRAEQVKAYELGLIPFVPADVTSASYLGSFDDELENSVPAAAPRPAKSAGAPRKKGRAASRSSASAADSPPEGRQLRIARPASDGEPGLFDP